MPLSIGQTQIIDGSCWFYNGGLASPSPYQTKLEVTLNSQDIVNNMSNITLHLLARSINPSYISSGNSQTPTIQGVSLGAMWFDCSVTNVWYDFGSRTINVPHNADGTLNLACVASFVTTKTSAYSLRTGSVSGNVELATIPRATLINSFNDFQIENTAGAITGNTQVYSNAFYHRFKLFQGSTERASWDIGQQAIGVYAFALTLTNAQRDAIFNAMPTIDNQQFTLQLITYSDAARTTQVGSTQTKTATGTIPASYKPAITTANSNYSWTNKNGKLPLYLIQNISTLTLLLSGGTVPTGATLAEYKVRFGTINRQAAYTGAAISENVGLIPTSGTLYAYYSVKDSRGRWSAEISETLIGNALGVQAYNPPINNGFDVGRNAVTPTSADYILKFANSLYSIGNTWTYTLQYWNGSSWATAKAATAITAASIDSVYTHALPYSESLVYNVKAVLSDQFNTAEYTDTLSTSEFPISFGKKGCGFGKDTSDTYNIEAGLLGIKSDGPIVSTVASGSAPLTVASSTVVPNLNADKVDGKHVIDILQQVFPVGSRYPTSDGTTNPATLLGFGTWVLMAPGTFLIAAGAGYALGSTGGTVTHVHSSPIHAHGLAAGWAYIKGNASYVYMRLKTGMATWTDTFKNAGAGTSSATTNTNATELGGTTDDSVAANTGSAGTLPPYEAVYIWKRTA
ncbi:MAG: DUF859 family phage minor structural protein [Erysipelotrichaceae bacterium]